MSLDQRPLLIRLDLTWKLSGWDVEITSQACMLAGPLFKECFWICGKARLLLKSKAVNLKAMIKGANSAAFCDNVKSLKLYRLTELLFDEAFIIKRIHS